MISGVGETRPPSSSAPTIMGWYEDPPGVARQFSAETGHEPAEGAARADHNDSSPLARMKGRYILRGHSRPREGGIHGALPHGG